MSIQDVVIVFFFFILPLATATIVPYKVVGYHSDILLLFLVGIIVLPLTVHVGSFLSPFVPRLSPYSLLLISFAFLTGVYLKLAMIRFRLKAEDIILDSGRTESKTFMIKGIFFAAIALFYTIVFVAAELINPFHLIVAAISFFLAVFWLTASSGKVYFTKDGISRFLGTIRWEHIRGYWWGRPGIKNVDLVVGYISTTHNITFNIPIKYQQQADEILQARVKWQSSRIADEGIVQN